MDERRVAAGVVIAIAVLAGAGLVVASGSLAPLLAADGDQPVSTPTATAAIDTPVASPTPTERDVNTATATRTGADVNTATTTQRFDGYERANVTVLDENGTTLSSLQVAIADTPGKRYTGLSDTEDLPEDRGMLFVYDSSGQRTYVMREMDFGLDIIYVGADGRIRSINHAPKPPEGADGEQFAYPGTGQYVLEVNINWTSRHDVSVGDRIEIDGYEG